MKCKNKILVVYWNNKKVQVLGSVGIVKPFANEINGKQVEEICNGELEVSVGIVGFDTDFSDAEIGINVCCNRCGKFYSNNITLHDIEITMGILLTKHDLVEEN